MKIVRDIATSILKTVNAIRITGDLETYILIAVVVVTVGLGWFGLVEGELIRTLTLGVLAVLAMTVIHVRSNLATLTEKFTPSGQSLFHKGPAHDIEACFKNSGDILLSGTSLTRTLRNHLSDIRQFVERGGNLRVLLVDPNAPLSEAAALRSSHAGFRGTHATYIESSLRDLQGISSVAPNAVEIRLSQYPFSFGAILVDADSTNASLHLRYYSYKPPVGEGPYFNLYPSDSWYEYFRSEVEMIWNDASVFDKARQLEHVQST